ncbi:MAG: rRNA maturation RNase YbeY [Thermodesulfobacteriota bacterium]
MGLPEAELSILLVEDEEIAGLNRRYLGRAGPTNVISFPMREGPHGQVNPELLGDVVISTETCAAQAADSGFSPEEMLDFYLIHGILHLAGYDHEGPAEEASRMEAKTWELFRAFGHQGPTG